MKKLLTIFISLLFTSTIFSQQINPKQTLTKQDYLLKSKKQEKIAIILSIGGAVLGITALAIFPKDYNILGFNNTSAEEKMAQASFTVFIAGGTAVLGSIPFLILSKKNKKKAIGISFKTFQSYQLQNINFVSRPTPALSLKIGL